jgi:hypothetical protein
MTTTPSATKASNKIAMEPTAIASNKVSRMLGFSLNGWENAMVVFLIIAGFFALLAGAATWAVVRLQRIELAESNRELERYKVEAGERIAGAAERANVAEQKAAEANLEIERLKTPRSISEDRRRRIVDRLQPPLAKPPFAFVVMLEPEPQALMGEIAETLKAAGWTRVGYHLPNGGMTYGDADTPDFGTISSLTGLVVGLPKAREADWEQVVDALCAALKAEAGIDAEAAAMPAEDAGKNDAVIIWIGRKP